MTQRLFLISITILLFACSNSENTAEQSNSDSQSTTSESSSEQWKVYSQQGKFGYKDEQENIKIEARFLNAEPFSHQVAIVESDSGFCLINEKGEIISAFYRHLELYKFDKDQTFLATKNYNQVVASPKRDIGEEKKKLRNRINTELYEENISLNEEDPNTNPEIDSMCLLNAQGKQVSKWYHKIESTNLQQFIGINPLKSKFVAFDMVLIQPDGTEIGEHLQRITDAKWCYIVEKKEAYYLQNNKGEIISKSYYEIAPLGTSKNLKCKTAKNSNYALLSTEGKEITPFSYREIEWIPKHGFYLFGISQDKKYKGILSENGQEIKPAKQFIKCYTDNDWIAISSGTDFAFYAYSNGDFTKKSDDYAVLVHTFKVGGRKSLHLAGRTISYGKTNLITEYLLPDFYQGLARVSKNKKYGFVNDQLQLVIPIEYDFLADQFNDNECYAEKDGKQFFIDKNGKEIKD